MRDRIVSLVSVIVLSGCASTAQRLDHDLDHGELIRQVTDIERAFARTMADRDHRAFTSYVSDEAIFFSGTEPIRGREQVADAWKQFFEPEEAPFSWEPDRVEVLDSGGLALSTGPVFDPRGAVIGTFTSIWRQEAPGRWRIVFDRGNPVCD